jgi:RsiW-degrading membrane proteinase PrsW (M82 family)
MFLFSAYSKGGESQVWATFAIRALLSVPGHVMFSAMWGYALGVAKFTPGPDNKKVIAGGVALAMGLHALFNFLVTTQPLVSIGLLLFLYFGWRAVNKKIAAALADSPHHPGAAASAILKDRL